MNKKTILILTLIVFSFNVQSQIIFEKGYFIDKTDTKIDCLIKNIDWKDSPKKIEYKTSENGELINIDTNTLKEFGIYTISKYVKNTVKIDKSLDNFNNLTFDKNPELVEETLFLKVLVEIKSISFYKR